MRYFSLHNGDHKLIGIGTGIGGNEISESKYNTLLSEIREKATLVDNTSDWQEEIQRRVDERIAAEGEAAEQDVWEPGVYGWTELDTTK